MRIILIQCFLILLISGTLSAQKQNKKEFKISSAVLKDKIKGGWAGQTIGVTFGGPLLAITNRWNGMMG